MKLYSSSATRPKPDRRYCGHMGGFVFVTVLAGAVACCLFLPERSEAQVLSVGHDADVAGASVDIPITFTAGVTTVSAIQFDLRFAGVLAYNSIQTGYAATAVGKTAHAGSVAGGVRVVVYGLNWTALGSGLVAVIRLDTDTGGVPQSVPLSLSVVEVSSPDADGIFVTRIDGSAAINAPGNLDTKPPTISDVSVSDITEVSATVAWATDELADSKVEYGTTSAYGDSRTSSVLEAAHSVSLSGLSPGKLYNFRVKSKDDANNQAVSGNFTFATREPEFDPKISLSLPLLQSNDSSEVGTDLEIHTGVAVTNLDSRSASLTFTALDEEGILIEEPGVANPVAYSLIAGGQLPIVDSELFGDLVDQNAVRWIKVQSSAENVTGFFLMFDSRETVLDGADLSPTPIRDFVFSEIEDGGFTSVHIANPGVTIASLRFDLVRSDGTIRASVGRTLGANGAIRADVFADLFPGVATQRSDYIRVTSDTAVLPFELMGKPSAYVQGLNGQDATAGGTTLYSPQYVVGGTWRSTLSIVSLDPIPGSIALRLIRDDGTQVGEPRQLEIAGHGKIYIDDQAFFQLDAEAVGGDELTEGYVEIVSNGIALVGNVTFGDPLGERFSSSIPLVSRRHERLLFSQVALNEVYFTGIAMLNPTTANATVTVDVFSDTGVLDYSTTEVILAGRRKASLLTEIFPQMAGTSRTSGYIQLRSDVPIASFSLFGTHDLSVLSAVPAQVLP